MNSHKQLCSFLLALVLLMLSPVKAQFVQRGGKLVDKHPVVNLGYPTLPDSHLKGVPRFDFSAKEAIHFFSTPMDSIKIKLLGRKRQIHSKSIVLSNGKIVVHINQSWNDSVWVNSTKDSVTTDSHGNLIDEVVENWDSSAWVNYYQDIYTYDANGH